MSGAGGLSITDFKGTPQQSLVKGVIESTFHQKGINIQSIKLDLNIFTNYNIDSLDLLELITCIYLATGSRFDLGDCVFVYPNRLTVGEILAKCA